MYFFRSHIVHLESVDSTEKLDPLNNKECLIMGRNILARFASTLKPPRSGDGYDKLIALTLGTAALRGIWQARDPSPYLSVWLISGPCVSTPHDGTKGTIQSP